MTRDGSGGAKPLIHGIGWLAVNLVIVHSNPVLLDLPAIWATYLLGGTLITAGLVEVVFL